MDERIPPMSNVEAWIPALYKDLYNALLNEAKELHKKAPRPMTEEQRKKMLAKKENELRKLMEEFQTKGWTLGGHNND